MIGALRLTGLQCMMTVNGGTDGDVFLTFVEQLLVPTLQPGDVVVMDNLGLDHETGQFVHICLPGRTFGIQSAWGSERPLPTRRGPTSRQAGRGEGVSSEVLRSPFFSGSCLSLPPL